MSAIVVNAVIVATLMYGWNYGVVMAVPQLGKLDLFGTVMFIVFCAGFDVMRDSR